ncbi:hypothetical protein GQ457_17G000290 [Hibiscus cannabinus]
MSDGSEKLKVFSGTVILCLVDLFFLRYKLSFLIFKIRQVGVFLGFADLLLLLRLSTKLDYPVTNRKLCFSLLDYALYLQVPIVHSIKDSVSTEEAADEYMFVIRQLVKTRLVSVSDVSDCPKFDLILVGNGHVASLFPNHSALYKTNEWVTFITREDNTHIASASNVAIVVTGESKAKAVHHCLHVTTQHSATFDEQVEEQCQR